METQRIELVSVSPEVLDHENRDGLFNLGTDATGAPVPHPAFASARGAMGTLEKVVGQLADAERQVASVNDPRTTDRLRAAARGAIGKALGEVEKSIAAIDEHAAQNEGKVAEKLGLPIYSASIPHGQRAADVRGYLRQLPAKERTAALRAIVAERDHEAVGAILSASPLASGISKRDHDALREDAENVFASGEVNLRAGLARLRGRLAQAVESTTTRFGALTGAGESAAARAERAVLTIEGGAR